MKGLMVKFLITVALPVLLALQSFAVSAGERQAEMKQMFRQETIREIRDNLRPPKLEEQRFEVTVESNKAQPVERKPVGYVSLISLIVNDAVGRNTRDLRVCSFNEAGKINF